MTYDLYSNLGGNFMCEYCNEPYENMSITDGTQIRI